MALHYPVADSLQPDVVDGRTIGRRGLWWSAVLAIHPKEKKPYIKLFKWRKNKEGEWKEQQKFIINNGTQLSTVTDSLNTLADIFTRNDATGSDDDV